MMIISIQDLVCFVILLASVTPALAMTATECFNVGVGYIECLGVDGQCVLYISSCAKDCSSDSQCVDPNGCCLDGFCQQSMYCPSTNDTSNQQNPSDIEESMSVGTIISIVAPSIITVVIMYIIYACIKKKLLANRTASVGTMQAGGYNQGMQNMNMQKMQQNQMMQQQQYGKQQNMFQNNMMMNANANPSYSQQNMMMFQVQPQQASFQQQGNVQYM